MNDKALVVVGDADGIVEFGATVFWEGARAAVAEVEAQKEKLPEGIPAPEAPSPVQALARAVRAMAGVVDAQTAVLSRPLGKSRVRGSRALVTEINANGTLVHATGAKARVERQEADGSYVLSIEDATPAVEAAIRAAYEAAHGVLESTDLTYWFQHSVLPRLDAVCLCGRRGIYYVPPKRREALRAVRAFVHAVHKGAIVHLLPTARSEEAAAAVTHAIVSEIAALCEEVAEKSAEGKYGKRALAAREADLSAAKAKLARYEALLGRALPQVHAQIEVVEGAVSMLQLSALTAEDDAA
jgi:hypothetical protein